MPRHFAMRSSVSIGEISCPSEFVSPLVAPSTETVLFRLRYELFFDDLPMWGFVGELKKNKDGSEGAYIFTHKVIDISYNKDRVRRGGRDKGLGTSERDVTSPPLSPGDPSQSHL